jgi:dihydroneopterin aldolase
MIPSDVIALRGIRAYGHHGVLPEERERGQLFLVDVDLVTDVSEAAASDDLAATVDYATVARDAVRVVVGTPCDLIETVAVRIADAVLVAERVAEVRVTVHKPQAPVGVPFDDVSVTVVRRR